MRLKTQASNCKKKLNFEMGKISIGLISCVLGIGILATPANVIAENNIPTITSTSERDLGGYAEIGGVSDWLLPDKLHTEVIKSTVMESGVAFKDIGTQVNGNAELNFKMYYRAVAIPSERSIWVYFRVDPKLTKYLPDYFEIKDTGSGYTRYAQLIKHDMIGGADANFKDTGRGYGGMDPYLNTNEPVYRVYLDKKGATSQKYGSIENKLTRSFGAGNWGIYFGAPVEAVKYQTPFTIPLNASWDTIKKETGQSQFTMDMRLQVNALEESKIKLIKASMGSGTFINEQNDESNLSIHGKLWLASTSDMRVHLEYEGKTISPEKKWEYPYKKTGKTIVRAIHSFPHGATAQYEVEPGREWSYTVRIDPKLLEQVENGDNIRIWAPFNAMNWENTSTQEPIFVTKGDFSEDGKLTLTTNEQYNGQRVYYYWGSQSYLNKQARSPFSSGVIVETPVKFTSALLPDDAGYKSYYFEGEITDGKGRTIKDSYATNYMNLYATELEYRAIKEGQTYNASDASTYKVIDVEKYPARTGDVLNADEFRRDYSDEYLQFNEKFSSKGEIVVNRINNLKLVYVYESDLDRISATAENIEQIFVDTEEDGRYIEGALDKQPTDPASTEVTLLRKNQYDEWVTVIGRNQEPVKGSIVNGKARVPIADENVLDSHEYKILVAEKDKRPEQSTKAIKIDKKVPEIKETKVLQREAASNASVEATVADESGIYKVYAKVGEDYYELNYDKTTQNAKGDVPISINQRVEIIAFDKFGNHSSVEVEFTKQEQLVISANEIFTGQESIVVMTPPNTNIKIALLENDQEIKLAEAEGTLGITVISLKKAGEPYIIQEGDQLIIYGEKEGMLPINPIRLTAKNM